MCKCSTYLEQNTKLILRIYIFYLLLLALSSIGLFLSFMIIFTEGRIPWTGQHKHRINSYTHQTSMPCVGFEPTIPASERVKTVHALHGWATVTGFKNINSPKYRSSHDVDSSHFYRLRNGDM
jgi:hypothetical protein